MKAVVQFVTLLGKITFNFDEPGVIQTCIVDTRKRVEIKHDFISGKLVTIARNF